MNTYILGDIHGQYDALQALLGRLPFDPDRDRLWLVGDLVNRGPKSLKVLRWARKLSKGMGKRMVVVLGNHDLHLLALAEGIVKPRPKDSDLLSILEAPDRDRLIAWLRLRPVLHRDGNHLLVHAGLHPQWRPKEAERLARRVEAALQGTEGAALLDRREPAKADLLHLWQALHYFVNLRTCTKEGTPCRFKGPPENAPPGCLPWFQIPQRGTRKATVIFGHWAALGRHVEEGVFALDSGAAWGGHLSGLRLEDGRIFEEKVEVSGDQDL